MPIFHAVWRAGLCGLFRRSSRLIFHGSDSHWADWSMRGSSGLRSRSEVCKNLHATAGTCKNSSARIR